MKREIDERESSRSERRALRRTKKSKDTSTDARHSHFVDRFVRAIECTSDERTTARSLAIFIVEHGAYETLEEDSDDEEPVSNVADCANRGRESMVPLLILRGKKVDFIPRIRFEWLRDYRLIQPYVDRNVDVRTPTITAATTGNRIDDRSLPASSFATRVTMINVATTRTLFAMDASGPNLEPLPESVSSSYASLRAELDIGARTYDVRRCWLTHRTNSKLSRTLRYVRARYDAIVETRATAEIERARECRRAADATERRALQRTLARKHRYDDARSARDERAADEMEAIVGSLALRAALAKRDLESRAMAFELNARDSVLTRTNETASRRATSLATEIAQLEAARREASARANELRNAARALRLESDDAIGARERALELTRLTQSIFPLDDHTLDCLANVDAALARHVKTYRSALSDYRSERDAATVLERVEKAKLAHRTSEYRTTLLRFEEWRDRVTATIVEYEDGATRPADRGAPIADSDTRSRTNETFTGETSMGETFLGLTNATSLIDYSRSASGSYVALSLATAQPVDRRVLESFVDERFNARLYEIYLTNGSDALDRCVLSAFGFVALCLSEPEI